MKKIELKALKKPNAYCRCSSSDCQPLLICENCDLRLRSASGNPTPPKSEKVQKFYNDNVCFDKDCKLSHLTPTTTTTPESAFNFLSNKEEDIYTEKDGKPTTTERIEPMDLPVFVKDYFKHNHDLDCLSHDILRLEKKLNEVIAHINKKEGK